MRVQRNSFAWMPDMSAATKPSWTTIPKARDIITSHEVLKPAGWSVTFYMTDSFGKTSDTDTLTFEFMGRAGVTR